MTLAEKFTRLKTSVGGNREKMHFEDTFGMPKEEQAHITRPGRANARILAELEFALHLSEAENGKYDAALEEALDYLLEKQQTEGVLTDQACEEAEEILEPIAEEAKSYELILAAHAHIDMNWMELQRNRFHRSCNLPFDFKYHGSVSGVLLLPVSGFCIQNRGRI